MGNQKDTRAGRRAYYMSSPLPHNSRLHPLFFFFVLVAEGACCDALLGTPREEFVVVVVLLSLFSGLGGSAEVDRGIAAKPLGIS
jgi:hypothetical protein